MINIKLERLESGHQVVDEIRPAVTILSMIEALLIDIRHANIMV